MAGDLGTIADVSRSQPSDGYAMTSDKTAKESGIRRMSRRRAVRISAAAPGLAVAVAGVAAVRAGLTHWTTCRPRGGSSLSCAASPEVYRVTGGLVGT
jgi:hypothetical protein